jgi:hypothetical protein
MAKLSTLLDQIDAGTVQLPEFQRGYVWNREQVRGLMRSLYLDYPVGSLLVWETETDPGAVRGSELAASGARQLLLDGQQRITSLYGVLRGRPPAFFEGNEKAFTGLRFNVTSESFEFYAPAKMRHEPTWVDVSDLFAAGGLQQATAHLQAALPNDEFIEALTRLMKLQGILAKEFHLEKIVGPSWTIDSVVDLFNKVNSGGTKLSKGDLALARVSAADPAARSDLRALLGVWEQAGYSFSLDWLLRNVNAVATGRASFSALAQVTSEEFRTARVQTAHHVGTFLDAVQGRLGLDHDRVLMGRYAIPVVTRLLSLQGGRFVDARERDLALYWYVHQALWGRFTASVESVLAREFEVAEHEGVTGLVESLRRWRGGNLTIAPHDFEGAGVGSRFYPLLYLMTRVLEARDFGTGNPLRTEMLGRLSSLQVHHLFPKAYLYEHGHAQADVNAVANFAFLTQATNLEIGKRAPSEYLPEIAERHPGVLESQWIPTDPQLWTPERYLDFLEARRELLAEAANGLLDGLLIGSPDTVGDLGRAEPPVDLETDERSGEVDRLATELAELGFTEPLRDAEIADPGTGHVLAVAEAYWPDGLQPGIGRPVVLELDPETADLSRLSELGFEVFTSIDALRGNARHRGLDRDGEEDTEDGAGTGAASTFYGYSADDWEELLRSGLDELREVARRRTLTSYTDLAGALVDRTGLEIRAHDHAFPHLLGQIATREVEAGGPLLSALCIYKGGNEPGEGFYAIARHHGRVPAWPLNRAQKEKVWVDEVSAAYARYA